MKVTIEIPDAMQQSLQDQLGQNLAQAAKEWVWQLPQVSEAEALSIGQVAELLGMSVYETDVFMFEERCQEPFKNGCGGRDAGFPAPPAQIRT